MLHIYTRFGVHAFNEIIRNSIQQRLVIIYWAVKGTKTISGWMETLHSSDVSMDLKRK